MCLYLALLSSLLTGILLTAILLSHRSKKERFLPESGLCDCCNCGLIPCDLCQANVATCCKSPFVYERVSFPQK